MSITKIPTYQLGAVFKLLRKIHGYTQYDVSQKTGCGESTVSSHERNLSQPDINILSAYCEVYNIELYQFFHLAAFTQNTSMPIEVTSDIEEWAVMYLVTK